VTRSPSPACSDEYVTIPFFALRASTRPQSDDAADRLVHRRGGAVIGNVQNNRHACDGSEVDTFFGCWLDINQPTSVVLPATRPARSTGPSPIRRTQRSRSQSMVRTSTSGLVARGGLRSRPTPGKDPSNWDKAAQRNLAWSDVGSALAVTTFETGDQVGLPRRCRG